ncbi:hypothetical protein P3X46_011467 [Hevea brasiliensis]|uniref:WRKY domain-containing protein n=1 Tax=Hevea brasiliensis TaxID=3981 RepID=A0ABQ9M794_HEVBR|nr:probable WRKY transcription factor 2 [Hevea brasiliensis]KAJ9176122.1 hypothetical protein P3X46_011467 [Hevea brasiliensis]
MDPNPPPQQPPSKTLLSSSVARIDNFTKRNCTISSDEASENAIRGSIAQRRAAKNGFKAVSINTARFRTTSPLASPAAAGIRSPCITIPPGISPTALLDSPIMLPNSQPSPTTGTFPLVHLNFESTMLNTVIPADMDKGSNAGSFSFKPHKDPGPVPDFATLENQGNNVDYQAVVSMRTSSAFEFPVEFPKEATTESCAGDSAPDMKISNGMIANSNFSDVQMGHTDVASNQTSIQMEPIPGENVGTHHAQEEEKRTLPATGVGRNSEDGYNWRKYGQKQVKGSEYPRSYYKCTHPNCEVKKKIEHSYDGQIMEIIYKGAHNHPKPQPNCRAQVGSASLFDEMPEMVEGRETCSKVEVGSVWKNSKPVPKDVKAGSDWKANGMERTSSTSVVTELSDLLSATHGKSTGTFKSAGTPELSSTLVSNDDDDDDGATQGSISLGVDADIEESESKRRRIESCLVETSLASRAVREPRVVVQIESEIDILDDGYRWRKYGQKVVKGNPNPRSYYKCTTAGCSVRKHVERASHNLKYVITTYEGKHNHEVPAARNSNTATNTQPPLASAGNTNRPKPETQIQDFGPGFDRKPVFDNDYLRHSFGGSFCNEMKLGASSIYPLKYPTFQHTMPYGSFEINCGATHHSGSIASFVPDFPISLPSSVHASANLSLAGVDFNYNRKPIGESQPLLSRQQLVKPKLEQRDDNLYDAGQSSIDHVNASRSSSSVVYQRIMENFPS